MQASPFWIFVDSWDTNSCELCYGNVRGSEAIAEYNKILRNSFLIAIPWFYSSPLSKNWIHHQQLSNPSRPSPQTQLFQSRLIQKPHQNAHFFRMYSVREFNGKNQYARLQQTRRTKTNFSDGQDVKNKMAIGSHKLGKSQHRILGDSCDLWR